MKTPRWIDKNLAIALHEEAQAEFCGLAGIRDLAALELALEQPKILLRTQIPTLYHLAASYAVAVIRHQPFCHDNQRASFMILYTFLYQNGGTIVAPEAEAASAIRDLSSAQSTECELSAWLRRNTRMAAIK